MKLSFKTLLITAGLAVFAAPGANAALVCGATSCTDSASFSGLTTELSAEALRVDKFEAIVGQTLDQVIVTITGQLDSSGTVTNNAAGSETFSVSTLAQQYSGALAGGITALPSTFDVFAPFTSIHAEAYTLAGGGTSDSFGPGGASTGGPLTVLDTTDALDLVQFIDTNLVGTDQFGYDFTTMILTTISGGGGNVATNINTTADATLTVTYLFSEDSVDVPEPASIVLLGFGLLAAGAARARRRRDA